MQLRKPILASLSGLLIAISAVPAASPRPKWELQFFYDQNDSSLALTDLKFPSAKRGIASGYITRRSFSILEGQHEKQIPIVLITSNGGQSWSQVQVKSVATSLFFLDESTGWLVADDAIYMTAEAGRSWRQVSRLRNISQVYFLSAQHGFATGEDQRVLETNDGGAKWTPVPAAVSGNNPASWTVYGPIGFAGPDLGLITGFSHPPDPEDEEPIWLHPESHSRPGSQTALFLVTLDGGKTWKLTSQTMYGELTRASIGADGSGLVLFEFGKSFSWPSDVIRINLRDGTNQRIFRQRNRAITDVLVARGGDAYAAGYEPLGNVHPSPIPGKVKILLSSNLNDWSETAVDYRAVARRVWLASSGGDDVWAATDTGMILKLKKP